jgi:hypothetical protein
MQLGETDCEEIHDGLLNQPINAWSSLSFSAVGLLIVLSAWHASGRERVARVVFGLLMVATGIGSFLFHGPQPAGSHFAHDITFLATVWFLAVLNLTEALPWQPESGWITFGGGVGVMSILLVAFPDSTNILTGIVLGGLVLADLAIHRRGRIIGWWYGVALGAMVIAVGFLVVGRSSSPFCDPGSSLQGHGGWHLFAAIALGAYFMATSPVRIAGRRDPVGQT